MLACLFLLRAHAAVQERSIRAALSPIERKVAMLVNIGATIAMGSGLYLILILVKVRPF